MSGHGANCLNKPWNTLKAGILLQFEYLWMISISNRIISDYPWFDCNNEYWYDYQNSINNYYFDLLHVNLGAMDSSSCVFLCHQECLEKLKNVFLFCKERMGSAYRYSLFTWVGNVKKTRRTFTWAGNRKCIEN